MAIITPGASFCLRSPRDIENTHYAFQPVERLQRVGPIWRAEWQKSRYAPKLNPIDIPARQPFTMADEDRQLL